MEISTDKTDFENLGKAAMTLAEKNILLKQQLAEQQFEGNDKNGLVRVCLQSSQIRDIQFIAKQPIAHDDLLAATKEAINDAIYKHYDWFNEEIETMMPEANISDDMARLFNSDTGSTI